MKTMKTTLLTAVFAILASAVFASGNLKVNISQAESEKAVVEATNLKMELFEIEVKDEERRELVEEKLSKIRKLNNIAQNRGQSLTQMALAWVLRDRVTTALVGVSKVSQLEENVGTLANLEFSEDELETIIKYGGRVKDVIVEQELDGELQGQLRIQSKSDLNSFKNTS